MSEIETIDHWIHEHPLALVKIVGLRVCYSCRLLFRIGEKGYECSQKCRYDVVLHQDCADTQRKIRHATHPQHTLTQQFNSGCHQGQCSICQSSAERISYRCTTAECAFQMHVRCEQGSEMMYGAEDDEEQQSSSSIIRHPSHPKHQLMFLRRSCSFMCDACGTTGSAKGSSYTCTTPACEYWIHQICASLPCTIQREDHHHSLSLSFRVPLQYLKYKYRCEVCRYRLISKHWIYHCELCSFGFHLRCAFNKSPHPRREKGIVEVPVSDVGEDLIGAFVRRQGGYTHTHSLILDHQDVVDYKFHNHKLRLVSSSSSSSSSFQEEEEEEEKIGDDDDEEEDYSCRKSELICNGCITPILVKQAPSSSSSSSSEEYYYYYMRCSIRSCKYYLHLACFQLPHQLSSLPLIHRHDHSLVLQSGDKLKPWEWTFCSVCYTLTNGLFYGCTKCNFKVDIKCVSMPDTIYHAAHPPHPLNLLSRKDTTKRAFNSCDGCNTLFLLPTNSYACGICDFIVHFKCAMWPASTTSRRWDKHHPLLLTHDANLNRPGDFYCDQCEEQMNPKSWMYHCRSCDISFHPHCFETTSREYRNIKFGQNYVIAGAHCHPLTFQLLTTKRRCDVCRENRHGKHGFYCAPCKFFICFEACGGKIIQDGNVEAVD